MAKAPRGPRRPTGPSEDDPDLLRHREIYEKAKSFEERVAELFRLLGYQTVVDYKRNDQQFDVRLEKRGVPPTYALVECKDYQRPVGQEDLLKFVLKVQHAKKADNLPYQPIFIARSGFVNNAHEVARLEFVHLMTFQELLLSLVDLEPNLEAAIRSFQGLPWRNSTSSRRPSSRRRSAQARP